MLLLPHPLPLVFMASTAGGLPKTEIYQRFSTLFLIPRCSVHCLAAATVLLFSFRTFQRNFFIRFNGALKNVCQLHAKCFN